MSAAARCDDYIATSKSITYLPNDVDLFPKNHGVYSLPIEWPDDVRLDDDADDDDELPPRQILKPIHDHWYMLKTRFVPSATNWALVGRRIRVHTPTQGELLLRVLWPGEFLSKRTAEREFRNGSLCICQLFALVPHTCTNIRALSVDQVRVMCLTEAWETSELDNDLKAFILRRIAARKRGGIFERIFLDTIQDYDHKSGSKLTEQFSHSRKRRPTTTTSTMPGRLPSSSDEEADDTTSVVRPADPLPMTDFERGHPATSDSDDSDDDDDDADSASEMDIIDDDDAIDMLLNGGNAGEEDDDDEEEAGSIDEEEESPPTAAVASPPSVPKTKPRMKPTSVKSVPVPPPSAAAAKVKKMPKKDAPPALPTKTTSTKKKTTKTKKSSSSKGTTIQVPPPAKKVISVNAKPKSSKRKSMSSESDEIQTKSKSRTNGTAATTPTAASETTLKKRRDVIHRAFTAKCAEFSRRYAQMSPEERDAAQWEAKVELAKDPQLLFAAFENFMSFVIAQRDEETLRKNAERPELLRVPAAEFNRKAVFGDEAFCDYAFLGYTCFRDMYGMPDDDYVRDLTEADI